MGHIQKLKPNTDKLVISGHISIDAALRAGNREIHKIFMTEGVYKKSFTRVKKQAETQSVPMKICDRTELDEFMRGLQHGDLIAEVGEHLTAEVTEINNTLRFPYLVYLDGIEDPYTFGYSVRALYAAGIEDLIVSARNWGQSENVMVRASAGAYEYMNVFTADSPEIALAHLKPLGYRVVCLTKNNSSLSIYEADLSNPLLVLIGGEKRGIKRSALNKSDLIVNIPYRKKFDQSLSTISAVTVTAFEICRRIRSQ